MQYPVPLQGISIQHVFKTLLTYIFSPLHQEFHWFERMTYSTLYSHQQHNVKYLLPIEGKDEN